MESERTVTSQWHGDFRCVVQAGAFTVTVDEPVSVGGTDMGPQPTELLLASVASCFTLALSFSARKRSIVLDHLDVSVTGTYDGPRFRAIRIDATIGCAPDEVPGLMSAAERVCYVTNTLRGGPELEFVGRSTATVAAERTNGAAASSASAPQPFPQ
jgi:putative redox protein